MKEPQQETGAGILLGGVVVVVSVCGILWGANRGYDNGREAGRCDATCASDGARGTLTRDGECLCVPVAQGDSGEPEPEESLARVTAYTPTCKGCSGVTYSGEIADPDQRTVAASLDHWRIGECVALDLPGEGWTTYTVRDTGGALDRADQLDLLVATRDEAKAWGRRTIRVRRVPCPTPHL
jgi:3D (Asp-Asp-Asp) domain-containing protein